MRLCALTLSVSKQSWQPLGSRKLDGWPLVEVTSGEQHLGWQLLGEQDQGGNKLAFSLAGALLLLDGGRRAAAKGPGPASCC
jgi:hypothetical protein